MSILSEVLCMSSQAFGVLTVSPFNFICTVCKLRYVKNTILFYQSIV